jgi:hypothetical protein
MGVELVVVEEEVVGAGLQERSRVSIGLESGAKEVKRGRQKAYTK